MIFDRSDSCRPALGGGVQLNSGAAVLARLDPALGAAVAKLGQPVRRVRSRTARGDARARERGLVDADGGVRAYTIMRDALQATLRDALGSQTKLELGAAVKGIRAAAGGGSEVALADGTARRFDLVAGCDGVRGAARGADRPAAEPLAVLGRRV